MYVNDIYAELFVIYQTLFLKYMIYDYIRYSTSHLAARYLFVFLITLFYCAKFHSSNGFVLRKQVFMLFLFHCVTENGHTLKHYLRHP